MEWDMQLLFFVEDKDWVRNNFYEKVSVLVKFIVHRIELLKDTRRDLIAYERTYIPLVQDYLKSFYFAFRFSGSQSATFESSHNRERPRLVAGRHIDNSASLPTSIGLHEQIGVKIFGARLKITVFGLVYWTASFGDSEAHVMT